MHAEAAGALEPLEQAAARQAARRQAGELPAVGDEVEASHEASRGPALRATMAACAAGHSELTGPATVNLTQLGAD